jgi:hypothetical protein
MAKIYFPTTRRSNMNEDNVTYMYGEEAANAQAETKPAFEVDDTVNIPRNEYNDLLEDSLWLRSLEDAGVNSWEGYDEALLAFDAAVAVNEGELNDD